MEQVMVSIYVATYNHEKYIVQALDSILMQKTRYSYEVFVGEDCSTDGTRAVLQKWEQEHPGVFHILYRQQNMGGAGAGNVRDLKERCTGKYIIALEGDDFWTDPLKLEKQVSFLETHPDYYAVAHRCVVVGKESLPNGELYPECEDKEYTFRHFASDILPGQLTTVMYKNYMCDPEMDCGLILHGVGPGDRNIVFSALCRGKIFCDCTVMSAYRHITDSGSSFSATSCFRYKEEEAANRLRMEYAYRIGNPVAEKYAEMLYLRTIRYALRRRLIDKKTVDVDKKHIKHGFRALLLLLKRDINYRLLHRKLHV